MFFEQIKDFFESIMFSISTMNFPADYLDILIVSYLIFIAIKFIQDTRAGQLARGVIIILISLQLSDVLGLSTVNFILKNTVQLGFLALLIVFQPELRSGLEKMGRNQLKSLNTLFYEGVNTIKDREAMIESTLMAVNKMARNRTGALIVFERSTKIGDIIDTGVIIDSKASAEMIQSVFFPNSPLHDGALVVRSARLYAAGCFLPLTHNLDLDSELGTRHRAALGMSEVSDAIVVVVSEETGRISVCNNGTLQRGVTIDALKNTLNTYILVNLSSDEKEKKNKKNKEK